MPHHGPSPPPGRLCSAQERRHSKKGTGRLKWREGGALSEHRERGTMLVSYIRNVLTLDELSKPISLWDSFLCRAVLKALPHLGGSQPAIETSRSGGIRTPVVAIRIHT